MKKLYLFTIALAISSLFNLNAQTLLAEFPLTADGVDITGNNPDMTILKAPFQNGGIYSNGIYYGNDTTGSHIQTQQIVDFNFDDLTVKVNFLIEEYPDFRKPIIMAGASWRWLSAWMDEDKIALRVNNGSIKEISDVVVSLNEWHAVDISYNKVEEKAWLHLDGELIITLDVSEITHGENSRIVNSDGGIGYTYKGYWRNLEVHNSSVVAGIEDKTAMENITLATRGSSIELGVPSGEGNIGLQIFDINGRQLGTYQLNEGINTVNLESSTGIKVLVFRNKNGQQSVRKLLMSN